MAHHHCWVSMEPGSRPAPGLLLAWEKRDGSWWGHVWLLVKSNAHQDYDHVTDAWLPAERLHVART